MDITSTPRFSSRRYAELTQKGLDALHLHALTPRSLYAPIEYTLSEGGKRLRPMLALMAAEAFGGDPGAAVGAAAGLEVFHNFTLLHDDVMDNSPVRRGRPTVHVKWDANTAILSGDAMLTQATQLMCTVPHDVLATVLSAFNDMAMEVYEGQALDMEFESRHDVSVEEYMQMIGKKTGALLGAAASIGATVGGASGSQASAMYDFGMELGLAFQICDDYLDVYGDPATFGKPIGGDILNNKKTFIYLTALASPMGSEIASAATLPPTQEKIAAMTKLYTACGAAEASRDAILRHSELAAEALRRADLDPEATEAFEKLLRKLIGRQQ